LYGLSFSKLDVVVPPNKPKATATADVMKLVTKICNDVLVLVLVTMPREAFVSGCIYAKMLLLAGLCPDSLGKLTAPPSPVVALGREGKAGARRKGEGTKERKGKGRVWEGGKRDGRGRREGEASRGEGKEGKKESRGREGQGMRRNWSPHLSECGCAHV